MERDPRGGEAEKASPVHSPSDSVIDDLLWTTYGINPRPPAKKASPSPPPRRYDMMQEGARDIRPLGGVGGVGGVGGEVDFCKRVINHFSKPGDAKRQKQEGAGEVQEAAAPGVASPDSCVTGGCPRIAYAPRAFFDSANDRGFVSPNSITGWGERGVCCRLCTENGGEPGDKKHSWECNKMRDWSAHSDE